MLKVRIIPCLDVKDGRVVKGINFINLKDAGDPVEQAKIYDGQGADELCFLDITASSDKRNTLLDVVAETAEQCFMPLTVGGGVRSLEDIRNLLLAGADKVGINTSAVSNPEIVRKSSEKFGSQWSLWLMQGIAYVLLALLSVATFVVGGIGVCYGALTVLGKMAYVKGRAQTPPFGAPAVDLRGVR